MRIVVLGAGLVGSAIVRDLASDPDLEITAVDARRAALDGLGGIERVMGVEADLSAGGRIGDLVREADLVISAVPGYMGFRVLKEFPRYRKPFRR